MKPLLPPGWVDLAMEFFCWGMEQRGQFVLHRPRAQQWRQQGSLTVEIRTNEDRLALAELSRRVVTRIWTDETCLQFDTWMARIGQSDGPPPRLWYAEIDSLQQPATETRQLLHRAWNSVGVIHAEALAAAHELVHAELFEDHDQLARQLAELCLVCYHLGAKRQEEDLGWLRGLRHSETSRILLRCMQQGSLTVDFDPDDPDDCLVQANLEQHPNVEISVSPANSQRWTVTWTGAHLATTTHPLWTDVLHELVHPLAQSIAAPAVDRSQTLVLLEDFPDRQAIHEAIGELRRHEEFHVAHRQGGFLVTYRPLKRWRR